MPTLPSRFSVPLAVVVGIAALGAAWGVAVSVGEVAVLIIFIAFIAAFLAAAASR